MQMLILLMVNSPFPEQIMKKVSRKLHLRLMCHCYPHDRLEPGLEETSFYDPLNFTYPSGTHIAEVEVDPATGVVEIVDWACCDDFNNLINPMIVEGQVHGGIGTGCWSGADGKRPL